MAALRGGAIPGPETSVNYTAGVASARDLRRFRFFTNAFATNSQGIDLVSTMGWRVVDFQRLRRVTRRRKGHCARGGGEVVAPVAAPSAVVESTVSSRSARGGQRYFDQRRARVLVRNR